MKAGFARIDITPPLGTPIAGYFHLRQAKGVRDPLTLNALALSDGNKTAVVIFADMIGITLGIMTELRRTISKRLGLDVDSVMISALHQHTAFGVRDHAATSYVYNDPPFVEILTRKFGDAAVLAVEDLADATVSYAAKETQVPLSFVRRYIMKSGPVVTNPKRCHPDLVAHAAESDNTVRLIRFSREAKNDIAFVNFSTHPDVIGGELLSADWPGFVRRYVEQSLDGVSCICGNGAQGDVNHINFFVEKQWDDRYLHSESMGKTIADTAVSIWNDTTPAREGPLFSAVRLLYTRTRLDDIEKYDACAAFLAAERAGTLDHKPTITELAFASRVVKLRTEKIFRPVPVSVLGFGDVAVVGFGGEPFTCYATNARNAAPDKFVVAACCMNGYEGYLPSEQAFAEGGYESSGSMFSPSIESECAEAARELLNSF